MYFLAFKFELELCLPPQFKFKENNLKGILNSEWYTTLLQASLIIRNNTDPVVVKGLIFSATHFLERSHFSHRGKTRGVKCQFSAGCCFCCTHV